MSTEDRVGRIEDGIIPIDLTGEGDATAQEPTHITNRMSVLNVPGVSIALIRNSGVVWSRGYGTTEAGSGMPVTCDTLFRIQSMTKTLTAVATLRLVEAGNLDLDTDVNEYLTSWAVPDSEFTVEQKVTLRRLLNHTSGLPETKHFRRDASVPPPSLQQVLDGEPPAYNEAARVRAVPGTSHQYANLGYILIQQILEDVTSKPYASLLNDLVLEPLGMKNTTLAPDLGSEHVAFGHSELGVPGAHRSCTLAQAHGELFSTAGDLARLAVELLRGARGLPGILLESETVRMMLRPDPELDPATIFGIADGQGLGLFLMGRGDDATFLCLGGGEGFLSAIVAKPHSDTAFVLLCNGANGWPLAIEVLNAIATEYGIEWGFKPMPPG